MTDGGYTISGEALARRKPVPPASDGSADHLTEQVSIEVDRLSGTMKDGVEALGVASQKYGNFFADTCAKMIQASMQISIDTSEHLLALLRARSPAEAFKLNVEFMQKGYLSTQGRLFAVMGVGQPAADSGDQAEGRGS